LTTEERAAKRRAEQESANEQRRQIEAARKLLQPHPVKLHEVPGWLNVRIRAYRRRKEWGASRYSSGYLFQETLPEITREAGVKDHGHWLDHWGTSIETRYKCCNEAGTCLVSEPYGFHTETSRVLDALAAAFDLTWHVLPNSWWYPGQTQRIVLHRRQKAPLHPSTLQTIAEAVRGILWHLTGLAATADAHLRKSDYLRTRFNLAQRRFLESQLLLQEAFPEGGFDVLEAGRPVQIDGAWNLPTIRERVHEAQGQLAQTMEALLETLNQDAKPWKKLVGVEQALDDIRQTFRFIHPEVDDA
jgi:hypothetical protein